MQYFYLIAHTIVGDDLCIDKIFLQETKAIRWGRNLATKNPDYTVCLYQQPILETGTLTYVKLLQPWQNGCDTDIDKEFKELIIPRQK